MLCPLCEGSAALFFKDVKRRWLYRRCRRCLLVFRDPATFLSPEQEKARYLTHRNEAGQSGYVEFLSPMVEQVKSRAPARSFGLDFGSGPGPVLAELLRKEGFTMAVYDPYFSPGGTVLKRRYDFVTCTEAAEHFHDPGREFSRLAGLLKPGGWLAVMTRLLEDREDFSRWWYRNDATHVCFYAEETLAWLAGRYGWSLERPRPGVACFRDSGGKALYSDGLFDKMAQETEAEGGL